MVNFEFKHRNFDVFIELLSKDNKFLDLRNDLASFTGAFAGESMHTFYADLYKICYDFFMKDNMQKKLHRHMIAALKGENKEIEITGVKLDEQQ